MAVVPKESIFASAVLKPKTFVVWCLLCEVRDRRQEDVYLDIGKAQTAGVGKSAYYAAFEELNALGWVNFSKKEGTRTYWFLVKGFDEQGISVNAENSANVENLETENSANVERNSAVTEKNSANAESNIRNKPLTNQPIKPPKAQQRSGRSKSRSRSKPKPLPMDWHVTTVMRIWAEAETPGVDVQAATDRFIDYYQGRDGPEGLSTHWLANWKSSMKRQLKWQTEDKNGKSTNGTNHSSNPANRRDANALRRLTVIGDLRQRRRG